MQLRIVVFHCYRVAHRASAGVKKFRRLRLVEPRQFYRPAAMLIVTERGGNQFRRDRCTLARRQMAAVNVLGDDERKPVFLRLPRCFEFRLHARFETGAITIPTFKDESVRCEDNVLNQAFLFDIRHHPGKFFPGEQGEDVGERMKLQGLAHARMVWRRSRTLVVLGFLGPRPVGGIAVYLGGVKRLIGGLVVHQ